MSTDGTFATLLREGRLVEFEKDDDDHRQPERCLYFCPDTKTWIDQLPLTKDPHLEADLPHVARDALSPAEQAFRIFDAFVYDAKFFRGDIPRMMPPKEGVYEIKTPSLRLMGAFHRPNVFICAAADYKRNLKGNRPLGEKYMRDVRTFFASLPLPNPKIDLRDVNELLGKAPLRLR